MLVFSLLQVLFLCWGADRCEYVVLEPWKARDRDQLVDVMTHAMSCKAAARAVVEVLNDSAYRGTGGSSNLVAV